MYTKSFVLFKTLLQLVEKVDLWQGVQRWIHENDRVENPLAAPQAPVFQLTLRLTHVLEDTYRQLAAADHIAFKRMLLVRCFSNVMSIFNMRCMQWKEMCCKTFSF